MNRWRPAVANTDPGDLQWQLETSIMPVSRTLLGKGYWNRSGASSTTRSLTVLKREDSKVVHIRKSSTAEVNHKEIYDALDLPQQLGKTLKAII